MLSNKSFVEKLWFIVNDQTNSNQIWWSEDGLSFIYNSSFQNNALKNSFQLKSLASFVRQLNMYGFKKRKHIEKLSEFHHPFFAKNKEDLLIKIRRKHLEDNYASSPSPVQPPKDEQQNQNIDINIEDSAQSLQSINQTQYLKLKAIKIRLQSQLEQYKNRKQFIKNKFKQFMNQLHKRLKQQQNVSNYDQSPYFSFIVQHLKPSMPVLNYQQYEWIAKNCFLSNTKKESKYSVLHKFIHQIKNTNKVHILQ